MSNSSFINNQYGYQVNPSLVSQLEGGGKTTTNDTVIEIIPTNKSSEGSIIIRALKITGASFLGLIVALSVAYLALGIIFQVARHTGTSVFPAGFSSNVAYVFSFLLLINGVSGLLTAAALYGGYKGIQYLMSSKM